MFGPPTKSGLSLVDFCGGYAAALALLAGVSSARRTGRGCDLDLSLFEVALAQLNYLGTWVASRGYAPVRRKGSAHQSVVPFQNFASADGWIVVACPKQALWERLCAAIERPDLAEAGGPYATFADRDRNRAALLQELDAAFASRTTAEWLEVLTAGGVPCAPVNDVAAALADEYFVLCPDTIGRGLSSWAKPEDYNFAVYHAVVLELLGHYGIDSLRWVGTSMGGLIGATLAAGVLRSRISHLVMNDIGPDVAEAGARRIAGHPRRHLDRARASRTDRRWERRTRLRAAAASRALGGGNGL